VKVSGTPLPQYDSTKSSDPAIGDTIPTLTGKSIDDGSEVTIGPDSGGKPQVIVFVAHWCPHCQAEVPRLVQLADDGAFDGVQVSAVATATNEQADNYPPSAWLKNEKWPFPVLADDAKGTAAQAYGRFVGATVTVAADAPLAWMRPSRLGDVPFMQRVLCLEGSGKLKLVPDNFADRPRTGQRQGVSQAVIDQPEFLMLPV